MESWIYVFAKFTSEALLFELLVICILVAGYSAFWVLKKRKLGAADQVIPVGLVKGYLNELIVDAETLRIQLFGLLAAQEAPKPKEGDVPGVAVASPELQKRIAELEAKMTEQAKAIHTVTDEKIRIEKELAAAK